MPASVTIKEIARQLGVSKSTVSRALRDSSEISQETKDRVLELARQLNYSPNPIALSLLNNRTHTLGIIVPEIANPFFSTAIGGVEDIAYSRGYHVMIYQSHESYERELIDVQHIATRRADGLIVSVSSQSEKHDHFVELQEKGIPIVFFDRVSDAVQTHKVIVDDYKGAYDATEHLIKEGSRRIAHIAGPPNLSISRNRLQGYRDALQKHGLPFRDEWVVASEYSQSEGTERAYQLMALRERPDAIFAASDRIAMGVHWALRQLGYRMPEDIALMGFSDLSISALLDPPLSSVAQPSFEMGQQAAELLLELIESKSTPASFETRVLKTNLVIRRSSMKNIS
ncbi:LacI family DNA-binding transcriptional regulator [Rhabdobacter roseus]|uniref:LacI family transcriptional regulator/LacI family repressor for deo operon, udp, cdd, tsx, nupC, and nupG n=1 Tax=Rhabdobacter roseus TaxID=1655419 RepID=A0A840TD73_9BACT|nr:LacI family DNA-binding transcriptional regulator [Rhabdobacter roseus]MBB5282036.1 LacI family transcriptional regulator/LacI family repressor for deo operon, udp, cdd, tsx, nupC, and nupG [Rhabdobacter roseus]